MADPKKTALLILAKGKPAPKEEGSEEQEVSGVEAAMEELKAALDAGDFAGAAEAFRSAAHMCGDEEV